MGNSSVAQVYLTRISNMSLLFIGLCHWMDRITKVLCESSESGYLSLYTVGQLGFRNIPKRSAPILRCLICQHLFLLRLCYSCKSYRFTSLEKYHTLNVPSFSCKPHTNDSPFMFSKLSCFFHLSPTHTESL